MTGLGRIARAARSSPGREELARGAVFRLWPVLSRLAFAHRRLALRGTRLVAVTGSLGKTSARLAISAALGEPCGQRTRANQFGFLALNLLAVPPWRRHAVLEVGIAKPGEMLRYAALLAPDVAVITRIASEHGSSLGTLDDTAREKALLAQAVPRGGLVVLNGDDPRTLAMRDEAASGRRCVTYGFLAHNDVQVLEASLQWPEGSRLVVRAGERTVTLRVRWVGRPMVLAVAAGVAVAWAEGVDLGAAARRLEALAPNQGRYQAVHLPGGAVLVRDDLKSPVESVREAIAFLGTIPARRRILVLGEVTEPPGNQGAVYRALGEQAAAVADGVVLVCDGKTAQRYSSGLRAAGMASESVTRCGRSVGRAVDALRGELGEGDVVLVKGRLEQRLERIALALSGRPVRCALQRCGAIHLACAECSCLESPR